MNQEHTLGVLVLIAAIIAIIGILSKIRNPGFHTMDMRFQIPLRILFAISATVVLIVGTMGISLFGDWYWWGFVLIGIIYVVVSAKESIRLKRGQ